MIPVTEFVDFISAIVHNKIRNDVFLFRHKYEREEFILALINQSTGLGLNPIVNRGKERVEYENGSWARLHVAYKDMAHRFAGLHLTGVHGLDSLDDEDEKSRFKSYVRSAEISPNDVP